MFTNFFTYKNQTKVKFVFGQDLRNFHEAAKTMKNKANGQFVTMKPRTATVAARFNDSLHNLLGMLALKR